jgi:hypothetical protein
MVLHSPSLAFKREALALIEMAVAAGELPTIAIPGLTDHVLIGDQLMAYGLVNITHRQEFASQCFVDLRPGFLNHDTGGEGNVRHEC